MNRKSFIGKLVASILAPLGYVKATEDPKTNGVMIRILSEEIQVITTFNGIESSVTLPEGLFTEYIPMFSTEHSPQNKEWLAGNFLERVAKCMTWKSYGNKLSGEAKYYNGEISGAWEAHVEACRRAMHPESDIFNDLT